MSKLSRNRRGNAAIVALSLASLLGFSALAVDNGMIRVTHAQLQNAVDAGAYGGSMYLDRTNEGLYAAVEGAVRIGNSNATSFGTYNLTEDDVKIGYYDTRWNFHEVTDFDTDEPELVNAVQVKYAIPDITAVLSRIFRIETLGTSASAEVIRPIKSGVARSVPCHLPLAIPDCDYLDFAGSGDNPPPTWFYFSNSNKDNIGWGNPFSNPSVPLIKASLDDQCAAGELTIDDTMSVNNGQKNSALKYIGDILNEKGHVEPTPWSRNDLGKMPRRDGKRGANKKKDSFVKGRNWGNTIQGPVALVDAGDCRGNPKFKGTMEITGFTWAVIFDGKSKGKGKNMIVQLDFITEHDVGGDISDDGLGNITGLGSPISVP